MRQFIANSTYFLLLIIAISIAMIGFNSVHHTANPLMSEAVGQQTALQGEVIQVGTDLDMKDLQPIGQAYYQQFGVRIEWLPIHSAKQETTTANDSTLNVTTPATTSAMTRATINPATPITNPATTSIHSTITATTNLPEQQHDKAIAPMEPSVTLLTLHPNHSKPLTLVQGLDMLLMNSAYSLDAASQNHQLQPLGSQALLTKIPLVYQDPAGKWFGVSQYGRTLVYHKNRLNPAELVSYSTVAADDWLGKLCMTALDRPENQAIAKLMHTYRGEKDTAQVLAGWQRNMGKPSVDDAHTLAQIEQGNCDVGIVDSDVFWQYAKTHPKTLVRLTWVNQLNEGVVSNTITAGAVKDGDSVGAALGFIEWLLSDKGQALLAFHTNTFPVITLTEADINQHAIRPLWANYKAESTPLATIMANKTILAPAVAVVPNPAAISATNLVINPASNSAPNAVAATR